MLLALLAMLPLLWPTIPPLVDLPGHMGRYRVQLDYADSATLRNFYSFKWNLIGNLGVDLLIIPLSKIFGLESLQIRTSRNKRKEAEYSWCTQHQCQLRILLPIENKRAMFCFAFIHVVNCTRDGN